MKSNDPLAPTILAQALEAEGKMPEALAAYQTLADRGGPTGGPHALCLDAAAPGHWEKALAAYGKALPFVSDGTAVGQQ